MTARCRFAQNKATTPFSRLLTREPFRLFFPLGLLGSVIGVSLWPLLYADWLTFYPAAAHARLMIQCFVGGFAMGFLATAFPKMIGSPSLTWPEVGFLLACSAGMIACHSFSLLAAGDSLFLLAWIFMILFLGVRLAFFRESLPPPGFVLAGMGVIAGICGTVVLLVGSIVRLTAFERDLSHLLLYEGFILGPILGVGSFLFPRFLKARPGDEAPECRDRWQQQAGIQCCVGVFLIASYVAQAYGFGMAAPALRALLVTTFLLCQVPLFRRGSSRGSLSTLLRHAVVCLILGILLSGVFPPFQVAIKHVLFIGGYGLLILTIASRVTWGHSGRIDLADGKRRSLQILLGVILMALATRVVADMIPKIKVSHHIYAALLWIVAAGIWWRAVLQYGCRREHG